MSEDITERLRYELCCLDQGGRQWTAVWDAKTQITALRAQVADLNNQVDRLAKLNAAIVVHDAATFERTKQRAADYLLVRDDSIRLYCGEIDGASMQVIQAVLNRLRKRINDLPPEEPRNG